MTQQNFNYEDYEDSVYTATIDLPADPGEENETVIVTNERVFAFQQLKHAVISDDGTDAESYLIDWSVQNEKRFWKGPIAQLAKMFGSTHTSIWTPFRVPVPVQPKTSLYIRVVNKYPDNTGGIRKLLITFEGMEKKNTKGRDK